VLRGGLDTGREFLGRGWQFPIVPGADGRLGFAQAEASIEQALWLILDTAPGERVMNPEFGCGIHDLVFGPNTTLARADVEAQVRSALVRFEPRIDVLGVSADAPESNVIVIRVDYRVRAVNTFNNLVYPFYISEGDQPS
jgi:uncharacterized protein